jgi:hypothetical protein
MSVHVEPGTVMNGIGIVSADYDRIFLETDKPIVKKKIVLRRMPEVDREFGFETIAYTDDASVKNMLKKVGLSDIIISLLGSDIETREAVYRNMTEKSANHVKVILNRLESGNALQLLIERSRNMVSEAFIEMIRE